MPFPDLRGPRRAVAKLLSGSCVIERDAEDADDDVIDPVTLELVNPNSDTTRVYSGPCLVTPAASSESDVGGQPSYTRVYNVRLPHTAPVIAVGDRLTVTASPNDPQLLDKVLRISTVALSGLLVVRHLEAELVTPVVA